MREWRIQPTVKKSFPHSGWLPVPIPFLRLPEEGGRRKKRGGQVLVRVPDPSYFAVNSFLNDPNQRPHGREEREKKKEGKSEDGLPSATHGGHPLQRADLN